MRVDGAPGHARDGTLEALPATLFVKYDPNDPTEQPAPISTDALERYAIQTMDAIADAIREARTAPPGYIIDDKGVVRKTTTSVVYQNRGRDSVEVEAGEMLLILAPVSTREAAEEGRK